MRPGIKGMFGGFEKSKSSELSLDGSVRCFYVYRVAQKLTR